MSTFEHTNSLRTIEVQIVQKAKNNEALPKFTGSYKKKKRVLYFEGNGVPTAVVWGWL